jgi:hypothetical protein
VRRRELTMVIGNITKNITVLLKGNNNSRTLNIHDYPFSNCADVESFVPFHIRCTAARVLQLSNLDSNMHKRSEVTEKRGDMIRIDREDNRRLTDDRINTETMKNYTSHFTLKMI